jgi:hypothetical protein
MTGGLLASKIVTKWSGKNPGLAFHLELLQYIY